MRAALLCLALISGAHAAEPLKPGWWTARLAFSTDGKRWEPMGAERGECLLPEQVSRVQSAVRRHLQLYGCRIDGLQLQGQQGQGAAACWPQGKAADFKMSGQLGSQRYQLELESSQPRQLGRLEAARTRECSAQEEKIAKTRLALEAEDGSSGAY